MGFASDTTMSESSSDSDLKRLFHETKEKSSKLIYLPILAGILPTLGLCVTYYLAKTNCHLERWILPYVSYTGTKQPESMIFSALFNMEGFLCFMIVLLTWKYYQRRYYGDHTLLKNTNFLSGIISCCGLVIIANFQITKGQLVHYIGAALLFISGTLYSVTGTLLSKYNHKMLSGRQSLLVFIARSIISIVMTISLCILLSLVAYKKMNNTAYGYNADDVERDESGICVNLLVIKKTNDNYSVLIDVSASIAEWILVVGLLVSITLYSFEFKNISMVEFQVGTFHQQNSSKWINRSSFNSSNRLLKDVTTECIPTKT